MLDHLVFLYDIQNIQLNIGLPQEFVARDIFCILKLFKFDETSLRGASSRREFERIELVP